jgi:1,4-dihydroxy-2-naphthoate polyprenyltransferase
MSSKIKFYNFLNISLNILKLARLYFSIPCFLIFSAGSLFAILTGAHFSIGRFFLGYSTLLAAQLAIQYSNDYFDYEADLKNTRTVFSGGSGVLIKNPGLKIAAKWIAIALMFISISLAVIFVIIFKYSFLFIGLMILANLVVWFYTAPPIKMAYRGLGEAAIIFNTGFLLPLLGFYTIKGNFTREIFIFIIPFIIYGLNFAVNVELPDFEADVLADKKNLISFFGRNKGYLVIFIFSIIGSLSLFLISYFFKFAGFLINFKIIGFATLPLILISLAGLLMKPSCLFKKSEKIKASIMVKYYLLAIIILLLFINVYFIYLII